jgi:hypothetical protein
MQNKKDMTLIKTILKAAPRAFSLVGNGLAPG